MLSLIVLTLRQKQLHLYVEDVLLPFCDFVVDSVEYLGQFFVDFTSLCKVKITGLQMSYQSSLFPKLMITFFTGEHLLQQR